MKKTMLDTCQHKYYVLQSLQNLSEETYISVNKLNINYAMLLRLAQTIFS